MFGLPPWYDIPDRAISTLKIPSLSDYRDGQILHLDIRDLGYSIQVHILTVLKPSTNSVALEVEILSKLPSDIITFPNTRSSSAGPLNTRPPKAFLKLSDRRFAESARRDCLGKDSYWTSKREKEVLESLSDKAGRDIYEAAKSSRFIFTETMDHTKLTLMEEYKLHKHMRCLCEREVKAYNSLKKHQGCLIPKLYASVTYTFKPLAFRELSSHVANHEMFQVQGILTEWIPGYKLCDMAQYAHASDFDYIVDRAVDVAGEVLNDSDVLNKDVAPKNILVSPNEYWEQGIRLVMFDFNMCEFRKDGETMEEWGLRKSEADEQGEISEIMRDKLMITREFDLDCEERKHWKDYSWGQARIQEATPESSELSEEDVVRLS